MADNDNAFGSFLAGVLIGGLVGAAAALLFAPQSGEETRTQIRDKSIEIRDRAEVTLDGAKVKMNESVESARTRVDELSQQVKQKMTPAASEVSLAEEVPPEPDKSRHD
jgi:gas vesicle protein